MFGGMANIRSYVTAYDDNDIPNLEGKWQPTGTTYLSSWDRKRIAEEREAQLLDEAKDLEERLRKAQENKEEQERIIREAEEKKKEQE